MPRAEALAENHVNSAVPPKTLKHKEISGGGVGSGVLSTPLLRFYGVNPSGETNSIRYTYRLMFFAFGYS